MGVGCQSTHTCRIDVFEPATAQRIMHDAPKRNPQDIAGRWPFKAECSPSQDGSERSTTCGWVELPTEFCCHRSTGVLAARSSWVSVARDASKIPPCARAVPHPRFASSDNISSRQSHGGTQQTRCRPTSHNWGRDTPRQAAFLLCRLAVTSPRSFCSPDLRRNCRSLLHLWIRAIIGVCAPCLHRRQHSHKVLPLMARIVRRLAGRCR